MMKEAFFHSFKVDGAPGRFVVEHEARGVLLGQLLRGEGPVLRVAPLEGPGHLPVFPSGQGEPPGPYPGLDQTVRGPWSEIHFL